MKQEIPRGPQPSHDVDWDLLALKLAIGFPKLYAQFATFGTDVYDRLDEVHNWIPSYVEAQEALGVYPMTGHDAEAMRTAVWNLMGKTS